MRNGFISILIRDRTIHQTADKTDCDEAAEARPQTAGDHLRTAGDGGDAADLQACRDTCMTTTSQHACGGLLHALELSGGGIFQPRWDVWPELAALAARTVWKVDCRVLELGEGVELRGGGMLVLCPLPWGNLWNMKVGVLMCLVLSVASLVAMVTSGRSSGRRRHKEVFLGENSKFKFGGWDAQNNSNYTHSFIH